MSNNLTVVKFGSELVCGSEGIDQEIIAGYVDGLTKTYDPTGLIVVTSGAVRAGEARLVRAGEQIEAYENVTLAQLGCTAIMNAWEAEFEKHNIMAGGLLTTHHEIKDAKEGPKLLEALSLALDRGVVSIINENDALNDEELRNFAWGGDNDGLASLIARTIGAKSLIIFTKGGGVYTDDGILIPEVRKDNYGDIECMLLHRDAKQYDTSGPGRGGIRNKAQAAKVAASQGIQSCIAAPNKDMTGINVTSFVW